MTGASVIRSFLQHSDASGTKSTVLKPLGWLIGMLVSASIFSFYFNAPSWVGVTFVIFAGLSIVLYLAAYVYFMKKDPDFLRSESFTLRKLEIEKGFVGDSLTGIIESKPDTMGLPQTIEMLPSGEDEK